MDSQKIKKQVMNGLFWKFSERILAQFTSLIVSIILARLLLPSDYGSVSMVMIFITIANVFVSTGFGSALVQKKDADDLDFSSVFWVNIIFSVIIYIIIFVCSPSIAEYFDMPIMKSALRVLGVRIIFAAINSVQQAYVSKYMLFFRFFWSTFVGTILSGAVGIYLAYFGFGIWALVFQYLTNTITDTFVLFVTVRWRPKLYFSWERAKSLLSYGWKMLASNLLDTGYLQLRSLVIGKVYSAEDLAYYNQGDKYTSFIITNINTSIGAVLLPAMATVQENIDHVKAMTKKSIKTSSYLIWPMMIGMAVVAEPFVRVVLTDKWIACIPYIRIFCFSYALYPIHTSNLQAINAIGRSDVFLKLEVVKKVVSFSIILLTIRYGPLAIAVGCLIDGAIGTIINAYPNKKLIKYGWFEQIEDIFQPLLLALIMGVVIYPIKCLHFSDLITLLMQIIGGLLVYILLSILIKQDTFCFLLKEVTQFIKSKK